MNEITRTLISFSEFYQKKTGHTIMPTEISNYLDILKNSCENYKPKQINGLTHAIVAMYAPHGVQFKCCEGISTINALYFEKDKPIVGTYNLVQSDWDLEEIQLCLRPQSELLKEIEINGSKFIPMKELFSCSVEEEKAFDVYGDIPMYWQTLMDEKPINWEFSKTNLLLKWKFDVFNLIKQGGAVDLKTVT